MVRERDHRIMNQNREQPPPLISEFTLTSESNTAFFRERPSKGIFVYSRLGLYKQPSDPVFFQIILPFSESLSPVYREIVSVHFIHLPRSGVRNVIDWFLCHPPSLFRTETVRTRSSSGFLCSLRRNEFSTTFKADRKVFF